MPRAHRPFASLPNRKPIEVSFGLNAEIGLTGLASESKLTRHGGSAE